MDYYSPPPALTTARFNNSLPLFTFIEKEFSTLFSFPIVRSDYKSDE